MFRTVCGVGLILLLLLNAGCTQDKSEPAVLDRDPFPPIAAIEGNWSVPYCAPSR